MLDLGDWLEAEEKNLASLKRELEVREADAAVLRNYIASVERGIEERKRILKGKTQIALPPPSKSENGQPAGKKSRKAGAKRGTAKPVAKLVLEVITKAKGGPIVAKDVIAGVQAKRPGIKNGTVYTTLHSLKSSGRLRKDGPNYILVT